MANNHTAKTAISSGTLRDSTLGSSRGLVKMGGELIAIPHAVPKTGYKAPIAYGAKPVFNGETTNQLYQKKVQTVQNGSGSKKKMMPYYPNASRNRPKESMENTPARRFHPPPGCKTETYRGQSHIKATSADPDAHRPWKTTNQVFQECTHITDVIGLANAGISSDVAKRTHKKQGIYAC